MPRGFVGPAKRSVRLPRMRYGNAGSIPGVKMFGGLGKANQVPGAKRLGRFKPGRPIVTLNMTKFFFDRTEIEKALGRAEAQRLKSVGSRIRQTARRSIRVVSPTEGQQRRAHDPNARPSVRRRRQERIRRRNAQRSRPGQPPLAHTRHRTRTLKYILYFYSLSAKSLIVGPVYFRTRKNRNVVPGTLEHGGTAVWIRRRRRGGSRTFRAHIAARPYMNPAMQRHLPYFLESCRNMW